MNLEDMLYLDEESRTLDPRRRDLEPVAGARAFAGMRVKGIDATRRTVKAIVSSGSIDRYSEQIAPEAWTAGTIAAFMKNPILLASHSRGSEDGSPTIIGKWLSLRPTSAGLEGTCQFLPPGDRLADEWWRRFEFGAARAFSIGFLTKAYQMRNFTMPDGKQVLLRAFTEIELLEISCVAIPACPDALVTSSARAWSRLESVGGGEDLGDAREDDDDAGGVSNRRLNKIVARAVAPIVKKEIRSALDADTDGQLAEFVRTVVQETIVMLLGQGSLRLGAGNDGYDETGAKIHHSSHAQRRVPIDDLHKEIDEMGSALDAPEDELATLLAEG